MASALLRASAIAVLVGGAILLAGSVLFLDNFSRNFFPMPPFDPIHPLWGWVLILGGLTIAVFGTGVFLWVFANRSS